MASTTAPPESRGKKNKNKKITIGPEGCTQTRGLGEKKKPKNRKSEKQNGKKKKNFRTKRARRRPRNVGERRARHRRRGRGGGHCIHIVRTHETYNSTTTLLVTGHYYIRVIIIIIIIVGHRRGRVARGCVPASCVRTCTGRCVIVTRGRRAEFGRRAVRPGGAGDGRRGGVVERYVIDSAAAAAVAAASRARDFAYINIVICIIAYGARDIHCVYIRARHDKIPNIIIIRYTDRRLCL